jgi:L-amino acid N-acyltransferase YncA
LDAFTAAKLPLHRHVATDTATGRVLGWVATTAVSSRYVYAGVIEHSIYAHPDTRGLGIAAALLDALIGSTETAGIWAIQSGIFPKTPPASTCTPKPDSAQSVPVTASDGITASGAASFS